MRLSVLISLAALALAGSAAAQPGGDQSGANIPPAFEAEGSRLVGERAQHNSQFGVALYQMRWACAADLQTLCADKKTASAADRCLRYHRLKTTPRCRQAQDHVQMIADGR